MKYFLTMCALLASAMMASASLLYDLVDGKYAAKGMEAMTSCADGEHYVQLKADKYVVKYSYRTGEVVDTLFSADDTKLMKVDDIEGFLFSPAENRMLVYRNATQVYRHSFTADYYLYDIKRNELEPLSDKMPVQEPHFSPNGRYIAFARANDLHVYKVDFKTEVAVTTDGAVGEVINGTPDWLYEEEFGVTRLFEWSPDSKLLAFVRFDESEVCEFAFQQFLNTDGSMKLYPDAYRFKYPKAGEANARVSVHVYDAFDKSIEQMQIGSLDDVYIPRLRWTRTADKLAVFKLNRNQTELNMYVANPKSTVARAIYTEKSDAYVDYAQVDEMHFLADNSFIMVNETDGYRHVYLYDANGLMRKQLTKGEYDVTRVYGYDEKAGVLYYQAAKQSPIQREVYALQLKKMKEVCLTPEPGVHHATFSDSFRYFVNNYSSLRTPNYYTLKQNDGKTVRKCVDNSEVMKEFAALNLPQKEFFTFETERGDKLNGWMLKPVGFDESKKYPVLQVQYSGPNSQQVLDTWKQGWEYHLATEGYMVVCVDGRGTGARGRNFRTCTYMQLGRLEGEDQISTAKYLGTLPYVDAKRIGIWGWSFGGFQTLVCMSQPEQVFKAGISVAPVTDWVLYDSAYGERFMRRPQENFDGYALTSPISMAEHLKGNLLIVHGTADDNVHYHNTLVYVNKLVELDKQFEMQIYTDDNHYIRKGNAYRHLHTRMVNFLKKNL